MSAMKDYLLDLESLLKEHKKELEGLKLENVLLEQGYQGQYLFAKKLAVQNNILYNELFSIQNKINETLALHGIGGTEREYIINKIFNN